MTNIRIIVKNILYPYRINPRVDHLIKDLNNSPINSLGFIKSTSYREFNEKDINTIYTIYDWDSHDNWSNWKNSSKMKELKFKYSDIIKNENISLLYKQNYNDTFLL